MDPYIGKVLDDRYEILDVLGTGGMAVVYRAYCRRLNRYVAVKILKAELATDDGLRRRFHDESQAVAMLSHANIMSVYDVSQIDGREFIVMELIDGITLKQYMYKRGGCLNWREALHFITQIMQALRHAHSRGIIHRDIKPQNIMVLRDGSAKVTDFGIARSTTSQATVTQETIGSVHYLSPEQAKGSVIDARSDLYSAGVVLYEMLTGRLPYEGENPVAVALQHINSIPVSPRELNSSVPLGLEQITLKAMASAVERRYAGAEQVLADLDAFRKNPEIDFGYFTPGVLSLQEDEPTVIMRRGARLADGGDGEDAGRMNARRQARFEREEGQRGDQSGEDYNEAQEEEDEKKNRIIFFAIIGVVCALIILVIILLLTLFGGKKSEEVTYTVPALVGCTMEEADALIAADEEIEGHFTLSIGAYESSEEYEAGVIISQTPASGTSYTAEITVITVTISSGQPEEEAVLMEDYTGQDYRLVRNMLDAAGYTLQIAQEYSDDIDEGLVTRTEPAAGSVVEDGAAITIYYSLGSAPATNEMPLLLGLSESYARSLAQSYGLILLVDDATYSDEYDEGQICYQSIEQNTIVTEGDTLVIRVSLGQAPVEMPNLLGSTQSEAEELMSAAGLSLSVSTDYSDSYDEGQVCYQSVSAGTEVKVGTTVSITVSLGAEPVEEEEETVTATKTITVVLPDERTESCVVQITVNGSIIYRGEISVDQTIVTKEYEGDIITCSVLVDGEEYDYGISG